MAFTLPGSEILRRLRMCLQCVEKGIACVIEAHGAGGRVQQGKACGREAFLPSQPHEAHAKGLPAHGYDDQDDATGRPCRHREAVTACDVANFARYGTTAVKSVCWWLAIPLIAVHWLRDGDDDPALDMELDISGWINVVLKVCFLAHIDHLAPLVRGRRHIYQRQGHNALDERVLDVGASLHDLHRNGGRQALRWDRARAHRG